MLLCIAVFVCVFVFFYCMHPLVILDSDDWKYVSFARPAVPSPTFWNPSRILPELLMPLCGSMALVLFRIGALGYIESQMLVFAICAAAFITAYTAMFSRLLNRRFGLHKAQSALFAGLFLILHFLIFRTADSGNLHLFWSYDVCCFFYYTIPAVLNCTLVMYFMSSDILESFFSSERIFCKAFLTLVLYLAVFSNLFGSVILAVYIALCILKKIIRKEKQSAAHIIILAAWVVAVVLESLGGRAAGSESAELDAAGAFAAFGADFKAISIFFAAVCMLCIVSALVVCLAEKHMEKEFKDILIEITAAGIIVSLAEIILCAKVSAAYMLRPQVFFGTAFFMLLFSLSCAAYAISRCRQIFIAVPVLAVLALTLTNTQSVTFAENNTMNLPWQQCIQIDNDIINQAVNADRAGLDSFRLEMMDTGWDDNWPHTSYMANNTFKQTLLKHGLINRDIEIIPVWSRDFNDRNGIMIENFSQWRHYE